MKNWRHVLIMAVTALALFGACVLLDSLSAVPPWPPSLSVQPSGVVSVSVDAGGDFVVLDKEGTRVWRMVKGSVPLVASVPGNAVSSVALAGDGSVWLALSDGLWRMDAQGRMMRTAAFEGGFGVGQRADGGVWAAYYLDGNAVFVDQDGAIWQSIPCGPPKAAGMCDQGVLVLTREGDLSLNGQPLTGAFEGAPSSNGVGFLPTTLAAHGPRVLIADMASEAVYELVSLKMDPARLPALTGASWGEYADLVAERGGYRCVSVAGGQLIGARGDSLILRRDQGVTQAVTSVRLSAPLSVLKLALYACAAACAALCLILLFILLKSLLFRSASDFSGRAVQLFVFLTIFVAFLFATGSASYSAMLDAEEEVQLRQVAVIASLTLREGDYSDIADLSFSADERVTSSVRMLERVVSASEGLSAAAYVLRGEEPRLLAKTGEVSADFLSRAVGSADITGRTGPYVGALTRGEAAFFKDESGASVGIAPVFDINGAIIAAVEVRHDLSLLRAENEAFMREMTLSLLATLIVILFFFLEVNLLLESRFAAAGRSGADPKAARAVGCVMFTAGNFPLLLLPLLAEKLYRASPLPGIGLEIAQMAPMTAFMLGMALAVLPFSRLMERKGWKPGFVLSAAFLGGGYALAAVSLALNSFYGFLFTLVLAGMGMGLCGQALQNYVYAAVGEGDAAESLSELNSGMFAGANIGVVFGGMIAERAGDGVLFVVAACVAGVALLMGWAWTPNLKSADTEDGTRGGSLASFIFDRRVFGFLFFMLIPAVILSFFVVHYLPIYADAQGASPNIATWGYLVQGVIIIYFGPMLTRVLSSKLSQPVIVALSFAVAVAGIAVFAVIPTLGAAIIGCVLLGLADAGGQSARGEYFVSLPASARIGQARALGAYGLVENIAQTVGPAAFIPVVAAGPALGMGLFAVIGAVFFLLFAVASFAGQTRVLRRNKAESKEL